MSSVVVFDIDGVLANTDALSREAYRLAGVEPPLQSTWQPWRTWLIDKAGSEEKARLIHDEKTRILGVLLLDKPPVQTAAAVIARGLLDRGTRTLAITAANAKSAHRVLTCVHLDDLPIIGTEVAPSYRPHLLKLVAPKGFYFDDAPTTVDLVNETAWTAIHVTPESTMTELLAAMDVDRRRRV